MHSPWRSNTGGSAQSICNNQLNSFYLQVLLKIHQGLSAGPLGLLGKKTRCLPDLQRHNSAKYHFILVYSLACLSLIWVCHRFSLMFLSCYNVRVALFISHLLHKIQHLWSAGLIGFWALNYQNNLSLPGWAGCPPHRRWSLWLPGVVVDVLHPLVATTVNNKLR